MAVVLPLALKAMWESQNIDKEALRYMCPIELWHHANAQRSLIDESEIPSSVGHQYRLYHPHDTEWTGSWQEFASEVKCVLVESTEHLDENHDMAWYSMDIYGCMENWQEVFCNLYGNNHAKTCVIEVCCITGVINVMEENRVDSVLLGTWTPVFKEEWIRDGSIDRKNLDMFMLEGFPAVDAYFKDEADAIDLDLHPCWSNT